MGKRRKLKYGYLPAKIAETVPWRLFCVNLKGCPHKCIIQNVQYIIVSPFRRSSQKLPKVETPWFLCGFDEQLIILADDKFVILLASLRVAHHTQAWYKISCRIHLFRFLVAFACKLFFIVYLCVRILCQVYVLVATRKSASELTILYSIFQEYSIHLWGHMIGYIY